MDGALSFRFEFEPRAGFRLISCLLFPSLYKEAVEVEEIGGRGVEIFGRGG